MDEHAAGFTMISVFLLSDNQLLRDVVGRILNRKPDIRVIGDADWSSLVVEDIVGLGPEVLIADLSSEHDTNSCVLRVLREAMPKLGILMINMDANREGFLRAIIEGASGYLLKNASANEVIDAVRMVFRKEAICPPELCRALFDHVAHQRAHPAFTASARENGLTRREQQLMEMLGRGLTNKEIAALLNLSEQTIKNHVHRREFGVGDRLSAVEIWRTQSLAQA
jgi:two-component system, NarL family, response regulator DevR